MDPLAISQIADLSQAVAQLIKGQLANAGTVSTAANQIIVSISRSRSSTGSAICCSRSTARSISSFRYGRKTSRW